MQPIPVGLCCVYRYHRVVSDDVLVHILHDGQPVFDCQSTSCPQQWLEPVSCADGIVIRISCEPIYLFEKYLDISIELMVFVPVVGLLAKTIGNNFTILTVIKENATTATPSKNKARVIAKLVF